MSNLKIYEHKDLGSIRIIQDKHLNPWFVAKDISDALGYKNSRDSLSRHVNNEDKADVGIHDGRQMRNMNIINESGMYSLILSSNLPKAKEFKRWVTSEVLPSIRKSGGYIDGQESLNNEELMAKALKVANNIIDEKEKKLMLQEEKVEFANTLLGSEDSILIGNLSTILKQNGLDIGRNRLFRILRESGFLIKSKTEEHNLPTQKSLNLGIMEVKENLYYGADELARISFTAKITPSGQKYFIELFLKETDE